jgi:hypothetical protein
VLERPLWRQRWVNGLASIAIDAPSLRTASSSEERDSLELASSQLHLRREAEQ